MLSEKLKSQLNNESAAAYVVSEDYRVLYMNPAAVLFTQRVSPKDSFLLGLCGRKAPCAECPLINGVEKGKVFLGQDMLCGFANVSFEEITEDNNRMFISRWNDKKDILADIAELDIQKAIDGMGGSRDAFNSVLEVYYHEGLIKPEVIKGHYENRDYYNLRIEVHGLKSTSYVIGDTHLGDFAKSLEFACRDIEANEESVKVESAKNYIDDELENLVNEYISLIKKLAPLYGDDPDKILTGEGKAASAEQAGCPEKPTDEEAIQHLNKAIDLLGAFELEDAQNHLSLAMETVADKLSEEYIKTVIKLIDEFNYDEASQKLTDWLDS